MESSSSVHSCCGGHGDHHTDLGTTMAAPGQYTCPMHPEVVSDTPGDCPKCGMTLEIIGGNSAEVKEYARREIRDLSRKFWIGLVLAVLVFVLAMGGMIPGLVLERWIPKAASKWIEFGVDQVGSAYVIHCPMVHDDSGADWLSPSTEILNPYFGTEMLNCGTLSRNLSFELNHNKTQKTK